MRTSQIARPLCGCGTPVEEKSKTKLGFITWASGCGMCKYTARKQRKDHCEKCGGTEKLHIDHIDKDRSNNKPSNLQTLCKDCHYEKTVANNEYRRKE
jgi:RecJ-like exonuclease